MESGRQHCLTELDARALIAGDLPPDRFVAVRDHLEECSDCRELLSDLVRDGADSGAPAPEATWPDGGGALPLIGAGTWIGNYRVDRPIGAGAMGVVYRGVDRSLQRPVAIKLLSRGGDRLDEVDHARMERESRALARLSHRNVVTVYQIGEHEGRRYLALEYVEGGTVREWLAGAPRSVREIVDLFVQAGHGLAAVHEAGFIHRDIKPDNLLVGADGRVRVGDFGLVRSSRDEGEESAEARRRHIAASMRSARLTETGSIMGTPRYMAPELLRGEHADERSDQWSYCASLWEALAGAPAYPGDLMTALDRGGEPRAPAEPERADRIPRRLRRILLRGLSHDPVDRWPSMRALVTALDGGRRRARATATLLVAGAAAGVALGIGFGVGADRPDRCAAAGDELSATWNVASRARLAAAMAPAGYPEGAIRSIDRLLDGHARDWIAARRSACVDAERAPGEAALATACLGERRVAFEAALAGLERPPRDPVLAVDAAADLAAVADCRDTAWLAGRQHPTDPQMRARVNELRGALAAARVQHRLGRPDADRAARDVLARARSAGFEPLTAESLQLAGQTARGAGAADARALLEESLTMAEAAADDVLVTSVWIDLIDAARAGDDTARVNRWLRHARAVATRIDQMSPAAHDRILAELAAVEGLVHRSRGALDQSEARLREALERETRSSPASPRVARAHARLAAVLHERGVPEQAAQERARAEHLARELVGPAAQRLLRE